MIHLILPYSKAAAAKISELLHNSIVSVSVKVCEDGYMHGYPSGQLYIKVSGTMEDVYIVVDVLFTGGIAV